MREAIRKRLREFVAIIALVIIAAGVGGYILSNQRLYLPGWVPIFGKDFFTLKAEFTTAQAVTPGQGQTVDIAGVKVGEVQSVELKDGRALVTMKIKPKYATGEHPIYHNAQILLRPKTGLKDMILELTPGSANTGKVKSGDTIPVQNTLPDINPDEVLASLDTDTRDYLKLLLQGAGEGLKGDNGLKLSAAFHRFDPISRDLLKITELLAKRRHNQARVIHNFQLLSTELSTKDAQISGFVTNSNAVFRAFANQDARLREALALLPDTLNTARTNLAKADTFAQVAGPTFQSLRPTARALGPTLRQVRPALIKTTPIIRDQIRPFARDALPTVKALRPAVTDLAAATPDITRTAKVVNYVFNELAYNPPGDKQEGYLFWASWANHDANSIFETQDAHGVVRRGEFIASCSALGLLPSVAAANPSLGAVITLINVPKQSDVCPKTAGSPFPAAGAASRRANGASGPPSWAQSPPGETPSQGAGNGSSGPAPSQVAPAAGEGGGIPQPKKQQTPAATPSTPVPPAAAATPGGAG